MMNAKFSITTDSPEHAQALIVVLEALENNRAVSITSPDESLRQSKSFTSDASNDTGETGDLTDGLLDLFDLFD